MGRDTLWLAEVVDFFVGGMGDCGVDDSVCGEWFPALIV